MNQRITPLSAAVAGPQSQSVKRKKTDDSGKVSARRGGGNWLLYDTGPGPTGRREGLRVATGPQRGMCTVRDGKFNQRADMWTDKTKTETSRAGLLSLKNQKFKAANIILMKGSVRQG